ncbi:MAG: hypothetical protein HQL19_08000, partial [Candidatus Omnitrophica bacterium]|nr:hypothetical protein [Candidatus Omnitrophota bacterium]
HLTEVVSKSMKADGVESVARRLKKLKCPTEPKTAGRTPFVLTDEVRVGFLSSLFCVFGEIAGNVAKALKIK